MEAWELIQACEMAPGSGLYGQRKFIAAVSNLTSSEFDRFCRTYLHLQEFYTLHRNAYYTDKSDLIKGNPNSFWKAETIDFDSPVPFIRRR
jgi:hypothetical protein